MNAGPFAVGVEGRTRGVATLNQTQGYTGDHRARNRRRGAVRQSSAAARLDSSTGSRRSPRGWPDSHRHARRPSFRRSRRTARSSLLRAACAPCSARARAVVGGVGVLRDRIRGQRRRRSEPARRVARDGQGTLFAVRGEGVFTWSSPRAGNVVLATLRAGRESGVFVEGALRDDGQRPAPRTSALSGLRRALGRVARRRRMVARHRAGAPLPVSSSHCRGGLRRHEPRPPRCRVGFAYRHPCGCPHRRPHWAGHRRDGPEPMDSSPSGWCRERNPASGTRYPAPPTPRTENETRPKSALRKAWKVSGSGPTPPKAKTRRAPGACLAYLEDRRSERSERRRPWEPTHGWRS